MFDPTYVRVVVPCQILLGMNWTAAVPRNGFG